jgi:FtsH-binding integral membrane protein
MQYNYKNVSYNTRTTTQYDEGLRKYFLKIYQLMSSGLTITALSAIIVSSLPALSNLMFVTDGYGHYVGLTGFGWLISFAPLGISLYFAFGYDRISTKNSQILFWIYAALVGMSLAALGLIYTGVSIARAFFICSAMFGGMSLYGYSTDKDLIGLGPFLFMGLIGLVLTSVMNIFLQSSAIEYALSVIGVIIFTGLIAYDTQKLKHIYYNGNDTSGKIGIMGAFTLYLDFINLFIFLMRFVGIKRND